MALLWSDEILGDARRIHERVRRRLTDLDVPGDLVLTGGASLPGVLTKGDVDLHLRVPAPSFERAVALLTESFEPAETGIWKSTLAVFAVPAQLPTGLAVTPFDSEHDRRFTRAWQRIAEDPTALGEYNRLKRESRDSTEYETRKSGFFDRITA